LQESGKKFDDTFVRQKYPEPFDILIGDFRFSFDCAYPKTKPLMKTPTEHSSQPFAFFKTDCCKISKPTHLKLNKEQKHQM
jgi:hypothetical protein